MPVVRSGGGEGMSVLAPLLIAAIVGACVAGDHFERQGDQRAVLACLALMIAASVAAIVLAVMDGEI